MKCHNRVVREIAIEVRAAAIAQHVIDANTGTDQNIGMNVEELVGWMRCADNSERGTYPKSPEWQAGWLAAVIYSHRMGENPA